MKPLRRRLEAILVWYSWGVRAQSTDLGCVLFQAARVFVIPSLFFTITRDLRALLLRGGTNGQQESHLCKIIITKLIFFELLCPHEEHTKSAENTDTPGNVESLHAAQKHNTELSARWLSPSALNATVGSHDRDCVRPTYPHEVSPVAHVATTFVCCLPRIPEPPLLEAAIVPLRSAVCFASMIRVLRVGAQQ